MGKYSGRYNLGEMMSSLTPEQKYKVVKLLKGFKTDMDNYRIGKEPMPKKFMYKYKDELLKLLSESDPDLNSFGRRKDNLLKKPIVKKLPYDITKNKNDMDYLRATGRAPREFFRRDPGFVDIVVDGEYGQTATVPIHIAKKYRDAERLLWLYDGEPLDVGDRSEYRKRKIKKSKIKRKPVKRCRCKK